MTETRPLSSVSAWIGCLLAAALAAQMQWQAASRGNETQAADLPPAPSARFLRAASFGEPELAARVAMLYLQAYDLRGDHAISFAQLDYARLIEWLRAIVETDPRSAYALFTAARVYTEVAEPAKSRAMLEFLHEAFVRDPDRRWPWLAHAALVAKHRLGDLPLALRFAEAIDRQARIRAAPLWAKQMQAFVLEEMNELESARIMLGGLIAGGQVQDANERRFLEARLRALEQRPGP